MRSVTKQRVAEILDDPNVKLIDARPIAAFNGWRLHGEDRGGHISGAVAFPTTWVEPANRVKGRLVSKKITPAHEIIIYGNDSGDGAALAAVFTSLGYGDVAVYGGGFREWAADDRLPVERLHRNEQLVHTQWLRDLLDGREVYAAPNGPYVVLHAGFGDVDNYRQGHIPGASFLDTNSLESSTDWNRRSSQELEAALLSLGINQETTVILYGRDSAADPGEKSPGRTAGQISASRAAAILLYAGVRDVRLLDGGYGGWVAAGFDVETEPRMASAGQAFGAEIPAQSEFFIDLDEAKELLDDPNGVLVSIRSWAEHVGKTSGYDYIDDTGDIPGAVWGNCGSNAYDMQHYRNVDNTMRDFNEIRSNWEEVGITPDKKVAFYCGTGWRASEAFFYAYLMGWPRVAVYDGGWFEWSRQMNRSGGTPGR